MDPKEDMLPLPLACPCKCSKVQSP